MYPCAHDGCPQSFTNVKDLAEHSVNDHGEADPHTNFGFKSDKKPSKPMSGARHSKRGK